jgi:hypothetical protein
VVIALTIKKKILFITQTAVMLAVLIGVQFATGFVPPPFRQFVTGSAVNLILFVTALTIGPISGLIVGVASPFLALTVGIAPPLFPMIPFIAAGNAVQVAAVSLVRRFAGDHKIKALLLTAAGLAGASAAKALTLWVGITKIVLSAVPDVPPPMAATITAMFTWPPLITALIGSALTLAVMPLLRKAVAGNR